MLGAGSMAPSVWQDGAPALALKGVGRLWGVRGLAAPGLSAQWLMLMHAAQMATMQALEKFEKVGKGLPQTSLKHSLQTLLIRR